MATIGHVSHLTQKGMFAKAGLKGWDGLTEAQRAKRMALILAMQDAEADRKITGGFDISRSNICGKCHIAKTVTGRCEC